MISQAGNLVVLKNKDKNQLFIFLLRSLIPILNPIFLVANNQLSHFKVFFSQIMGSSVIGRFSHWNQGSPLSSPLIFACSIWDLENGWLAELPCCRTPKTPITAVLKFLLSQGLSTLMSTTNKQVSGVFLSVLRNRCSSLWGLLKGGTT